MPSEVEAAWLRGSRSARTSPSSSLGDEGYLSLSSGTYVSSPPQSRHWPEQTLSPPSPRHITSDERGVGKDGFRQMRYALGTGVHTCALPIWKRTSRRAVSQP